MRPELLSLASEVIQGASRKRPADRVLRETLKRDRRLSAANARAVSRVVFSYYRWYGWLDHGQPLWQQLRRAEDLADRFAADAGSFPAEALARRVVPEWVHQEAPVTTAFARALQSEPKVWLRARTGQGRGVAKALGECRPFGPGPFQDTLEYFGSKDLLRTPEFHAGCLELQDLSSQAVGFVCAPSPGETWWDACAGEGGKLLHLSALMRNKGLIWSSDRAAWRLARLKRRAARAGVFNYRSALWDGNPRLPTGTRFDGILVDAPCSGIGTWHRNPQARWTTTSQDVTELAEVQLQLLRSVGKALKPGGKLVYSVCTVTHAETFGVADRFSKEKSDLKVLPLRNPLEPQLPPGLNLCFKIEQYGGNGMFIAAWRAPS